MSMLPALLVVLLGPACTGGGDSGAATVDEPVLVVAPARSDGMSWADEPLELLVEVEDEANEGVALRVERSDGLSWDGSGWSEGGTVPLSAELALTGDASEPAVLPLRVVLVDAAGDALAEADVELVELGRRLVWGDLHAHSNLSHDGCERADADCADRATAAAVDAFQRAADRGLDFAALTDHAEWVRYQAVDGGAELDIWQAQLDLVADAEGGPVLPLLGYEWTAASTRRTADGHRMGGHRTVLFEATEVCADWRVSSDDNRGETYDKAVGQGSYVGGNPVVAREPADLVAAFQQAAASCGDQRLLMFSHHTAWDPPQPLDWGNPAATPDERYEPVVEIYSEHGSSECIDWDAPDCAWRAKSNAEHFPAGSIQAALSQGYRLGFIAGSDAHDASPGSIDDGPSCTAIFDEDLGEIRCHDHGGGLAGVMIDGALDRTALLDGLEARRSVATSGPRLPVRAVLRVADRLYLPGDVVPAGAATVLVSVEGLLAADAPGIAAIELLDQGGAVLASTAQDLLEVDLDPLPGEARYLRLRFEADPASDAEGGERMWLSPWFFE